VWIHGAGRVRLGDRVRLDASLAPIELHVEQGAELILEDDVHIEGGTSLEAQQRVHIGARSRLGAFCKVLDNHFHPLRGDRHARPGSTPVQVGEDVQLGARVILLPGAQLERGVRVLPATVVSRRIPAGVHVGGQPARRVAGGQR
jgi:acetyltransferase-like isoleucine patch superfamily enzyme